MIEPYQAVGLVPTVWGIRKREDILKNLEHLAHLVKAAPGSAGSTCRCGWSPSRRARCRASTTRCSTSTT